MTPLRVALLTHYYPPEVGAPPTRLSTLASLLAERGAEVIVHTGFPNYPDGALKQPYRNRPFRAEWVADRLRVVRSIVYPTPNRGFGKRVLNHGVFAAGALATASLSGPADVVVAETPPLFTAAAGVQYARRKRAPLVLNVSDKWPESAIQLGALSEPRAVRLAASLERWCYRNASAITVPTDGLQRSLTAIPEADGRVLRLGPSVDTGRFAPSPRPEAGPLQVLYAGTVGMAQGLGTLVTAAAIAGPEVEVSIAGDGAEAPEVRSQAARTPNVRMLGTLPQGDIPKLYEEVDAAAVLLRDRPIFAGAVPIKLLEGMAAARPIVLSARGEAARIVEDAEAGLVVPPEDPSRLASALVSMARDRELTQRLGANGRRAALDRFDWARTVDGWWDLLHRIAGQSPKRPVASFRSPASRGLRDAARL